MADSFVSLGLFAVLVSWMSSDCGFVGNLRKLYTSSHGYRNIPTVTEKVTLRTLTEGIGFK